jgi:hypothetical protein
MPIVSDGSVHAYQISPDWGSDARTGPWLRVGLGFSSREPGSIDVLSVTVIPKSAEPAPATVEWRFDQAQPDWRPAPQARMGTSTLQPVSVAPERTPDALRVTLPEDSRGADGILRSGLYIDLPSWRREEWAHVIVTARTSSVTTMAMWLNPGSDITRVVFARYGGSTPIVSDGSVQTYQVRPEWGNARVGRWLRLGLEFRASEPGSIDILSVRIVPIDALYANESAGVRSIAVGRTYRRSLFTHAPGRLEYRVHVPEGGRLQAALGVLSAPVDFRVTAQPASGEVTTLLRETHADPGGWTDRTVDLSSFAGQTITLGLETAATTTGTVAFWGSPTLSGARRSDKPNVILYVIDGGWADDMSVYGYNRWTTPFLERLAAEGWSSSMPIATRAGRSRRPSAS